MTKPIKLVVFDQDGVLVLGDALDDMAEFLGCGSASRELTRKLQAGEITLRDALTGKKALFKNMPTSRVTKALTAIKYDPDTMAILQELRRRGIKTMLVTGSWTITAFFTQRKFKLDYTASSDAKTTMAGNQKIDAIDKIAQQLGITTDEILAVGNTSADTPMLRHVGRGLCLRPVNGIDKDFPTISTLAEIVKYL